jgi:hypothetical protein
MTHFSATQFSDRHRGALRGKTSLSATRWQFGATYGTIRSTASLDKIEVKARSAPGSMSFTDAVKLATSYFGDPRQGSGSHVAIFKMPWQGDLRINLQNKDGKAKPYQVSELIKAIDRLKEERQ